MARRGDLRQAIQAQARQSLLYRGVCVLVARVAEIPIDIPRPAQVADLRPGLMPLDRLEDPFFLVAFLPAEISFPIGVWMRFSDLFENGLVTIQNIRFDHAGWGIELQTDSSISFVDQAISPACFSEYFR